MAELLGISFWKNITLQPGDTFDSCLKAGIIFIQSPSTHIGGSLYYIGYGCSEIVKLATPGSYHNYVALAKTDNYSTVKITNITNAPISICGYCIEILY